MNDQSSTSFAKKHQWKVVVVYLMLDVVYASYKKQKQWLDSISYWINITSIIRLINDK